MARRTSLRHDRRVPRGRSSSATDPSPRRQALAAGVTRRQLDHWLARGELVRPIRGVFHDVAWLTTSGCAWRVLRLVVPEDCVVTDRTAAWLWGAPTVLAPGDHLATPRGLGVLAARAPAAQRAGRPAASEGSVKTRRVRAGRAAGDDAAADGVRPRSPAAPRPGARRHGRADVAGQLHRRGARRRDGALRRLPRRHPAAVLAALVDPLAGLARGERPATPVVRRRPAPAAVPGPGDRPRWGSTYYIDLGLEDAPLRCRVRRGGVPRTEASEEHDAARRLWLSEGADWRLVVARAQNVYGQHQDAERAAARAAAERILRTLRPLTRR